MSETEILSVPLDAEMKREADKIFGELGVTTADAVRFFLCAALRAGEHPFDAIAPEYRYNKETIAAMEECRRLAHDPNAKRYASIEELMASLLEEDEDGK